MRFRKLGLVFCPDGGNPLMRAFAIAPTPLVRGDAIRVYFGSTDANHVGRVFFLDLERSDPRRALTDPVGPVLLPGREAAFDHHGVNPVSIVPDGSDLRLYYVGYQRPGGDVPYTMFTGLAVSRDGGNTFSRVQDEPVLGPTFNERFFRTAANVHRVGERWCAWYIGGGNWTEHEGKKLPVYGLRYAESRDGISWRESRTIMDADQASGQIGFGRPYVIQNRNGYRMFLSVRNVRGYSISHARSDDGFLWTDWNHGVIPSSAEGWDSEMCCYAAAVNIAGQEFVFYNGNGFGRSGFGIAVRED